MEITHIGHSCFRLKGKAGTLITDPYDPSFVGLPFPKHLTPNIVTVSHSHPDHYFTSLLEGDFKTFSAPGEYEADGISLIGIATFHDNKNGAQKGKNICFLIEMDQLRLLHLGDLGHLLTQNQLDQIGSINILFVPTGGIYTSPKQAAETIHQIEPSVVIPMHYQEPKLAPALHDKLLPVDDFLKTMGVTGVRDTRYSVSSDKLPEEFTVVILDSKA